VTYTRKTLGKVYKIRFDSNRR